jgi:rubrerythrin
VAPSTALRRWYGHEPEKFAQFRRRYNDELCEPARAGALNHLTEAAREGTVTLLTASRDAGHSQAAVLAERLRARVMNEQQRDDRNRAPDDDAPGDPACWMRRVCPACGALADTDPPVTCPQCHATIPGE